MAVSDAVSRLANIRTGTGSENPPLRILVLIAAANIESGPVKGCLQFIRGLQGDELAFHLVAFRRGPDDPRAAAFAAGAAAVGVRVEFVIQPGRDYVRTLRELRTLIAREDIDIVQSHGFKPAALCAWLRLRHGLRWICFCHGTTTENWRVRLYHRIEALVRLAADRVVLVAEAQRTRTLRSLARGRVRVLRNGIDLEAPVKQSSPPTDVREQLGLAPDERLLVAVGRLSPEKGIDVLIDALVRLQTPRVRLVLVGDGPERERLRARADRAGLAERVAFVGHVATPGDYLQAADVVVLPSRSEGIPNVALEAMALGRPLVATAVGGTPEIVVDGVSGILVRTDDPKHLAAALDHVLTDSSLAARLADGAREHAALRLSAVARCSRLRELYAEFRPALAAPASPSPGRIAGS